MAYKALTAVEMTAPYRVEGHTSNVTRPIPYKQTGTITSANLTAGDTINIPHKLTVIEHINITPLNAAGATSLYGAASGAATLGAYVNKSGYNINWEAVGATAIAGATTVTLGTSASAVADVYNNSWLDITHSDGTIQTVQITDYAVTTKVATISEPLSAALTTANKYRLRGTVYTSPTAATAPSFSVEILGHFD